VIPDDERPPAWRRYARFFRGNPARDVDDELAFHIQSTIDELVAGGMQREAAYEQARAKFGDVERIGETLYTLSRERERRMALSERLATIKQDVVFGLRQLRKAPGFTAAVLLTLALGIGANSAIFSVVYAVMLKPLPFANSDRLITVGERSGANVNAVTFGNYAVWRDDAHSLAGIAAVFGGGPRTMTGRGDPTPITTLSTTGSFWNVEFIPPVVGRYYTTDEERASATPVAVLSQALWLARFNGDTSIVGKQISLNGTDFTVVGIAPQDHTIGWPAEMIWVPMKVDASQWNDHSDHELSVYALVKPDVPIGRAAGELSAIERRLAKQYPNSGFEDVDVRRYADDMVGPVNRVLLLTLLGAVTLVLLIACANVANLLIARGNVRRAEIAIRGALGASRGRIVGQLLVESSILAFAGGLLGLLVAWAGVRFLVTSPAAMARLRDSTVSGPVVGFTFAVAVVCAILFGLLPALKAARTDLQQTLRDGGRESSVSARDRVRGLLVAGELCLVQVLLVGAALLIRSATLLQRVEPGFSTDNLLITNILLPPRRYATTPGALEAGFLRLDQAIAAIPGVKAVGRSSLAPVQSGGQWNCNAMRPGSNGHDDGAIVANMRGANGAYFAAIGEPLIRGRAFDNTDVAAGPPVAIITRRLAHDLYGDADPVGQLITSCASATNTGPIWRTVVGVVGDTRARGRADDPPREMYMPSAQWPQNFSMAYLIRGAVPVSTLLPSIRRAVATVDPELALSRTSTMDDAFAKLQATPRFTMWLLILLGGTGLALALVGVYGVIAYLVAQRTHEFGVRMALGAEGGALQWMVVREGVVLGIIGVVAGTVVATGLARFLEALMFGITTRDPLTYAVVAAGLATIAAAASYVPARRATRIDPLVALRGS
jgi:putative ABC transport system permease protein